MLKFDKYVYEIPPIDIWAGWIPFEKAFITPTEFSIREYDEESGLDEKVCIKEGQEILNSCLNEVKSILTKFTSWEGDGDIYISSMPFPNVCLSELVFAVKQANNGTTYIVAPAEYFHLREYLVTSE